jgi:hypothetical protein
MNAAQHRQAGRNALAAREWATTSGRLDLAQELRNADLALAQLAASTANREWLDAFSARGRGSAEESAARTRRDAADAALLALQSNHR